MERSIFTRNKISRKALEWGFFREKKLCFFWKKVDITYKMLYNIIMDEAKGAYLSLSSSSAKNDKKGGDHTT